MVEPKRSYHDPWASTDYEDQLSILSSGLGLADTGIQIAGGLTGKGLQSRMRHAGQRIKNRTHAYGQGEIREGQRDVNETAWRTTEGIKGNANERGISNSSIRKGSEDRVENERSKRYNALQRRYDLNESNFQDQREIENAQKSLASLKKKMALISAAINTGTAGVGSFYGGML